ncbi:hypothetical protein RSSM_02078 [Rhodopirellula sallentina SM41]|uniref:Sulfotransferase family protein n=2 Tax=Rhodopirellula TaxID=265488 RepID=M5U4V1_9BACT|nr:hypothetical protein RSSM_02078 [Rhodopirellula sallentina SM41]
MGSQISVDYTPYKVGSTTLFERLCEPRFCAGGHLQAIKEKPPAVAHFTVKCHSGDSTLPEVWSLIQRPFQRIITLVRPAREIYLSAFFQNIDDSNYDYHFGSRDSVLNASTQSLADHFMSVPWNRYPHLQFSHNAQAIEEYCGVDYRNDFLGFPKTTFHVYHGNTEDGAVMVAVARMNVLRHRRTFCKFIESLGLPFPFRTSKISMLSSNVSASKWYSDKQKALIQHPAIVEFMSENRERAC